MCSNYSKYESEARELSQFRTPINKNKQKPEHSAETQSCQPKDKIITKIYKTSLLLKFAHIGFPTQNWWHFASFLSSSKAANKGLRKVITRQSPKIALHIPTYTPDSLGSNFSSSVSILYSRVQRAPRHAATPNFPSTSIIYKY